MGGLICFSLSAVAVYIVITGKKLSGGLPFLSSATNQMIGQILISSGACATFLMGLFACYELYNIIFEDRDSSES